MANTQEGLGSDSVPLDRDGFLLDLVRDLSGTLQDVVGEAEASGFISVVGQRMGDRINDLYRATLDRETLDREQVAAVLVDLKARIQGDFYIVSQDDEKIVLGNRKCPFGERVVGRPTLCMMTSNVFGVIASENLGFAKVAIEAAIARGDAGCQVTVYLRETEAVKAVDGRAYFKA